MKAPVTLTHSLTALSLVLLCSVSQVIQPIAAVEAHAWQAGKVPSPTTPVAARPLAPAEFASTVARLDKSVVPNVVGQIKPNRQQSFLIKGQGFPDFSIVPVRYESTSADSQEPTYRCGVYVISAESGSKFVRTLGYDNREAEVCGDLLGVGFLPDHAMPPRIILLYNGGSFNSPGKDPVILAWSMQANGYASDDQVVTHLNNAATIPAIKGKLKVLKP